MLKKTLFFFNVHYDHQGVKARQESSRLILQKIRDIAGNKPVIFTGALNGGHEPEWYKALAASGFMKDAYRQTGFSYISFSNYNCI